MYLESKRRKSSISSLTLPVAQERTQGNNWGITTRGPKKEDTTDMKPLQPKLNPQRSSASMIAHGQRIIGPKASSSALRPVNPYASKLDKDDLVAEEEMRKMASRRKETEQAAKVLDALRKRATPKERVSPQQAVQMAHLNIYERGEIVDFKDVYFCGTQSAAKHVGKVQSDNANFGYDDERGDYSIVKGDHLAFRYEIIDILGKGSFGQVVRCIDHKTGGLVAIKIIRNKKRFHQQALVEVNILQKLREWVRMISHLPNTVTNSADRIQQTNIAWSTSRKVSTSVAIFASLLNFLI
jgi:dual specificity tyrosine-phosphorylation-regulated kinase 2/3/4